MFVEKLALISKSDFLLSRPAQGVNAVTMLFMKSPAAGMIGFERLALHIAIMSCILYGPPMTIGMTQPSDVAVRTYGQLGIIGAASTPQEGLLCITRFLPRDSS